MATYLRIASNNLQDLRIFIVTFVATGAPAHGGLGTVDHCTFTWRVLLEIFVLPTYQ